MLRGCAAAQIVREQQSQRVAPAPTLWLLRAPSGDVVDDRGHVAWECLAMAGQMTRRHSFIATVAMPPME